MAARADRVDLVDQVAGPAADRVVTADLAVLLLVAADKAAHPMVDPVDLLQEPETVVLGAQVVPAVPAVE